MEVAKISGPGSITEIWLTSTPTIKTKKGSKPSDFGTPESIPSLVKFMSYRYMPDLLERVFLRIYFDGSSNPPSVNAPIGAFFGSGFGEYKQFMSHFVGMVAGGFISKFHMPFRKNAKIEIYNSNENRGIPRLYLSVSFLKYAPENDIRNKGYFHAEYRSDDVGSKERPYVIADIKGGKGHFVGMVLGSKSRDSRGGFLNLEGDIEMYVDGEKKPSLISTGTEDEFGGGWYYLKNSSSRSAEFFAPYHGLTTKSFSRWGPLGYYLLSKVFLTKTSQYKFFPETIPFLKSFKCLAHVGEKDEVVASYNSLAYWYQEIP